MESPSGVEYTADEIKRMLRAGFKVVSPVEGASLLPVFGCGGCAFRQRDDLGVDRCYQRSMHGIEVSLFYSICDSFHPADRNLLFPSYGQEKKTNG
jgi:hypothetical protein